MIVGDHVVSVVLVGLDLCLTSREGAVVDVEAMLVRLCPGVTLRAEEVAPDASTQRGRHDLSAFTTS